jgi:hypothetical protein
VLMNFFTTNPSQSWACVNNSSPLIAKLRTCYDASAKRWPNFIAVDFYMVLHTYSSAPYVRWRPCTFCFIASTHDALCSLGHAVQRSSGGGAPLATDVANGRLQCGCDTIAYCKVLQP